LLFTTVLELHDQVLPIFQLKLVGIKPIRQKSVFGGVWGKLCKGSCHPNRRWCM